MGKITWGATGPFETLPWGGVRRVDRNDPRVANDPRWAQMSNEVGVSPDGDTNMSGPKKRERSDTEDTIPESSTKKQATGMEASENVPPTVGKTGNLALTASGAGSNGTGETPVNLNVKPQLGLFTETHTAILPLRFGVSFNQLDANGPDGNTLKIRVNAPYNILRDTTFVNQTAGGTVSSGISVHQAQPYSSTNPSTLIAFETTLRPPGSYAGTDFSGVVADPSCVPAWRKFFEKVYESYHTIETQYRITIVNPETTVGRRARVCVDKDVYTTSSTGNVIPTDALNFYYNSQWKDLDSVIVPERNNSTNEPFIKVYEGTWRPGEWSKNTLNSEDIKAWYSTGAEPTPNWVENLVVMGMTDEYNTSNANLNLFVELRYIVQFKDLRSQFRYPRVAGTATTFSTPSAPAAVTEAAYNTAAGDMMQIPFLPVFGAY